MKTGTAVALIGGGFIGLLVLGGAGVGAWMLLRKPGEGENLRVAQLEQQKAAADAAARIAEADAKKTAAQAQAEAAKAQAKAADKEWWEIGLAELAKGTGEFVGSLGSLW